MMGGSEILHKELDEAIRSHFGSGKRHALSCAPPPGFIRECVSASPGRDSLLCHLCRLSYHQRRPRSAPYHLSFRLGQSRPHRIPPTHLRRIPNQPSFPRFTLFDKGPTFPVIMPRQVSTAQARMRSSLRALVAAHGGPDHPRAVEAAEFIYIGPHVLANRSADRRCPSAFSLERVCRGGTPGSSQPSAVLLKKDTFEADVVTEHSLSSPELFTARWALQGFAATGRLRWPADGGRWYLSILNVSMNNNCASHRCVCIRACVSVKDWIS